MANKLLKKWFGILTSLALAITLLVGPGTLVSAARDCDDNAVIRCGVTSIEELKQKYRENQGGNVQAIFREFGITSEAALDGMVMGRVTSSNEVYVGDKLVATNAITVGRQNMPGSTAILDGAAYKRAPSVSFRSASLDALVKMDGDKFLYGVILSCGNAVTATPVATPPKPAPAPQPAPQPQPQPTPSKSMPEAGAGNMLAIFLASSILGTAYYYFRPGSKSVK